jgi:hypothetical protein
MIPPVQPDQLFANFGPLDAPLFDGDSPSAIAIPPRLDGPPGPIGIAYGSSYVRHRHRSVATWRLVVHKEELPGRSVCIGRRFIEVGDWLERIAMAVGRGLNS